MIDNPDDTTELEKIFNTDSDSIIAHFKVRTFLWSLQGCTLTSSFDSSLLVPGWETEERHIRPI